MKYQYMPDSYNWELLEKKGINIEDFLKLQKKYRTGLENVLKKFIDFEEIDRNIEQDGLDIPVVLDEEQNFYRRFSTLNSKYVFLRNNFHIENLTEEEIRQLIHNQAVSIDFLNQTLSRVIFEEGDYTLFGPSSKKELVKSKSIVFEFAFDQKKCKEFDQLMRIEDTYENVFNKIQEKLKPNLNIPISFHTYRAIPDLFSNKKQVVNQVKK